MRYPGRDQRGDRRLQRGSVGNKICLKPTYRHYAPGLFWSGDSRSDLRSSFLFGPIFANTRTYILPHFLQPQTSLASRHESVVAALAHACLFARNVYSIYIRSPLVTRTLCAPSILASLSSFLLFSLYLERGPRLYIIPRPHEKRAARRPEIAAFVQRRRRRRHVHAGVYCKLPNANGTEPRVCCFLFARARRIFV